MTLVMVSNLIQKLSSQLLNFKLVKPLLIVLQPLLPKLKPMPLLQETSSLTMVSLVISFSSMVDSDSALIDSMEDSVSVDVNLLVEDVDSDLASKVVPTDGLRLVITLNSPLLTLPMTSRFSLSPTMSLRNTRSPRRSQK
jgi:hypothetical protein